MHPTLPLPVLHTFWSTKYLFTRGIQQEDGCVVSEGYASRMAGYCMDPMYLFQRIGTECHATLEEAQVKARKMVTKKLKALEEQRKELLKLQAALEPKHDIPACAGVAPTPFYGG